MEETVREKHASITRTLQIYLVVLFILSLVAAADLVLSIWNKEWAYYGLALYLMLTAGSIWIGHSIKQVPAEAIRDELNIIYHRMAVIILNSFVGSAAVIVAFLTDFKRMIPALTVAVVFYAIYAITYLARIIRPNSMLARFRSVMSRVLIIAIICETILPNTWRYVLIPCLLALSISGEMLYRDYKKGLFSLR